MELEESGSQTLDYTTKLQWSKHKIMSFAEKWMDLETVVWNEVGQKEKTNIVC